MPDLSPHIRLGAALLCLTVATTIAACGAPSQGPARQYTLQGQILDIRRDDNVVLIKHGDIEGFMPGMTMPFKVRDARLLDGKAPGDLVVATLSVADTEAWLDTLQKTGSAPLAEKVATPAAAFVEPLAPGNEAPDTVLTDQDGEPLSLQAWRGSAVAITFIYIRCPLPEFCPLLDRKFAGVQRAVAADEALRGRVRLLSVSFDPDADTPSAMRDHAARLAADPDVWRFATAPKDVVDRFAARFGVNVIREADGTITHNMRTAVLDTRGRLVAIHDGADWTVSEIVDDLRRAIQR